MPQGIQPCFMIRIWLQIWRWIEEANTFMLNVQVYAKKPNPL